MTLREYIDSLQKFAKKYKAMDFKVFYAIDDEGNAYKTVGFHPTAGYVDDGNMFNLSEDGDLPEDGSYNAVCIN